MLETLAFIAVIPMVALTAACIADERARRRAIRERKSRERAFAVELGRTLAPLIRETIEREANARAERLAIEAARPGRDARGRFLPRKPVKSALAQTAMH